MFKKRKAFCIKYYDDIIYDTSKEFLKKSFTMKESQFHMEDIKNFYTKFKDYPRFFEVPFVHIMGAMVRRQRRIEYYKVFKGKKEEQSQVQQLAPDDEFQLIDMLGDSFKQIANKNQPQSVRVRWLKSGEPQPNNSFVAIQKNFKELKSANFNKNFIDFDHPFSNDYFTYHTTTENYYPLYSVNDSHSAIHNLADIIEELKIEDNPKPKLKLSSSTTSIGTAQTRASFRINSPKYNLAKTPNQIMKPQLTASTSSAQKTGFSTNSIPDSAANLALANKIFSNPNLSRQNQRDQVQSNGRSRSEKEGNSPSIRVGSKSNRNLSSEKGEPQFFKGREIGQKVNTLGAQGFTPAKQSNNNEALAANLNTSKRKLIIDMQDININRTNLYKSITDKFKTSKNLNGIEAQLPGKDLSPYTEAGLPITRSNTTKPTMAPLSPGKKYIISKRSESALKSNYPPEHASAISSNVNDENFNRFGLGSLNKKTLRKSSSQGPTDRVLQNYQLNTSGKGSNGDKQIAIDEREVNQVLMLKPTTSDPTSHLTVNVPKKFFQGGLSPGIPKTISYRQNQMISKGSETPQSNKRISLVEQMAKLEETPKTATNLQNEGNGFGPSFSQAIKSHVDSQRSRSLNPSSSKLKIASPQTRLQSYRQVLSNRKKDHSAQNHG